MIQTHHFPSKDMRTLSSIFRAVSLELLKNLSVNVQSGGTHFIRCIRADLDFKEKGFNDDMVRQQLRALSVADTARAKQKGYSHRVSIWWTIFWHCYKYYFFHRFPSRNSSEDTNSWPSILMKTSRFRKIIADSSYCAWKWKVRAWKITSKLSYKLVHSSRLGHRQIQGIPKVLQRGILVQIVWNPSEENH